MLSLSACQTPTGRIYSFAQSQQFERSVYKADGFDLLVLSQHVEGARFNTEAIASTEATAEQGETQRELAQANVAIQPLNVYLEGDGTPWRFRRFIMSDPTSRNALMLRLMSLDIGPSLYIGRPCYNGTSMEKGCDSALWTSARYSAIVVNSMVSALHSFIKTHHITKVRLLGHSGGGTLAMLMARDIPEVIQVVTLAGNLDTDGWTTHHHYTPLYGSLNPAKQRPLSDTILQWHFVGGHDVVVPPLVVKPFILEQKNALGISIQQFDHGCCWLSIWPTILDAMQSGNQSLLPGERFAFPKSAALPELGAARLQRSAKSVVESISNRRGEAIAGPNIGPNLGVNRARPQRNGVTSKKEEAAP